jgi:titin
MLAFNAIGDGLPTDTLEVTPLALPDAPMDTKAEVGDREVTLTWLRPPSDGGTRIVRYAVHRGPSPDDLAPLDEVDGSVQVYSDLRVVPATNYYYAVTAITAAGEGPLSIVVSAKPYGPPKAPGNLTAVPGNGEVSLFWEPPDDDGGSPVSGYVIMRGTIPTELSELAHLATITSYKDTAVTNGRSYHYTVVATNEAGPGDQAPVVDATPSEPATSPDKVLVLAIDPKGGRVRLQWAPPGDDGGSPVTGYVVLRGETTESLEVVANPGLVTSWTDEDVKRGGTYYYSVSAVNDVGEGEPITPRGVKVPRQEEGDTPGMGALVALGALLTFTALSKRKRKMEDSGVF